MARHCLPAAIRSNATRYRHVCRRCFKLFQSQDEISKHASLCRRFASGRAACARRCYNYRIFRPYERGSDGYLRRSTISYKTGFLRNLLPPLTLSFLDYESITAPLPTVASTTTTTTTTTTSDDATTPAHFEAEQMAFSFCLSHASCLDKIFPLPPELMQERSFYSNIDVEREETLYLYLLSTLHRDLGLISKFLRSALASDHGPASLMALPPSQRHNYLTQSFCIICGNEFGSMKRLSSGKIKTVTKVRHHDHLADGGKPPEVYPLCESCNLHLQTSLSNKTSFTVYSHFGSGYDAIFTLRGCLLYGRSTFPVLDADGDVVERRPLLRRRPDVLLKSASSILSIRIFLNCASQFCETCTVDATLKKRLRTERLRRRKGRRTTPTCAYSASLVFKDSLLLLGGHSLDALVTDLAETAARSNVALAELFPNTQRYVLRLGVTDPEEQRLFMTRKLKCPFESMTSFQSLLDTTSPPSRETFLSKLSHNPAGISDNDLEFFLFAWKRLNAPNLLALLVAYNAFDVNQLADATLFHLRHLHALSGIWCSHLLTLPQASLQSCLLNVPDPLKPSQPIQLETMSRQLDASFGRGLIGGYAAINALYYYATNSMLSADGLTATGFGELTKHLSGGVAPASACHFYDMNQLYSSCLSLRLPHSRYRVFSMQTRTVEFLRLAARIRSCDSGFFSQEAEFHHRLYFVTLTLHFDENVAKASGAMDLCGMPTKRTVPASALTHYQRQRYRNDVDTTSKTEKQRFPNLPRLISSCDREIHYSDFLENIFLLCSSFGATVINVEEIISCLSYNYMTSYVETLCQARTQAQSTVQGKLYKLMTNSLAGRFHMAVENLNKTRAVTTAEEFDKVLHNPTFYDFVRVGTRLLLLPLLLLLLLQFLSPQWKV